MAIEAVAAAAPPLQNTMHMQTVEAGYGAGLSDVSAFQGSLHAAAANVGSIGAGGASSEINPAMKAMFTQLEKVNGEAKSMAEFANTARAAGSTMTPGEIVQLTVRCQEFMFHCQLTSNIANRTSDGVQQLFRQQS